MTEIGHFDFCRCFVFFSILWAEIWSASVIVIGENLSAKLFSDRDIPGDIPGPEFPIVS